jgi:hypothetical protein
MRDRRVLTIDEDTLVDAPLDITQRVWARMFRDNPISKRRLTLEERQADDATPSRPRDHPLQRTRFRHGAGAGRYCLPQYSLPQRLRLRPAGAARPPAFCATRNDTISTSAARACAPTCRDRSAAPPRWCTFATSSRSAYARVAAPGRRRWTPPSPTAPTSLPPTSCMRWGRGRGRSWRVFPATGAIT